MLATKSENLWSEILRLLRLGFRLLRLPRLLRLLLATKSGNPRSGILRLLGLLRLLRLLRLHRLLLATKSGNPLSERNT